MAKDIILSPNSSSSLNLPADLDPTNGTSLLLIPHEPTSNIKARTELQFKVCYKWNICLSDWNRSKLLEESYKLTIIIRQSIVFI